MKPLTKKDIEYQNVPVWKEIKSVDLKKVLGAKQWLKEVIKATPDDMPNVLFQKTIHDLVDEAFDIEK